jgi:hypothetical protein
LRLESTLGQLVPGRCKAVNQCDYCARLAAIETAEVLALDAMTNSAPGLWSVLTTRTATMDVARFQHARRAVRRAIVKRWPEAEMATLVEFTTGEGRNSAGARRPHWNDAHKGIPTTDREELRDLAGGVWCKHVDAEMDAQHFDVVTETGGLMRYLALHFQKESQQPPKGWRGHRFRTTRGYLAQPMEAARLEARQALRFKRELWRAQKAGLSAGEADEAAHLALYEANELAWSLVRLQNVPTAFNEADEPTAWEEITCPIK